MKNKHLKIIKNIVQKRVTNLCDTYIPDVWGVRFLTELPEEAKACFGCDHCNCTGIFQDITSSSYYYDDGYGELFIKLKENYYLKIYAGV